MFPVSVSDFPCISFCEVYTETYSEVSYSRKKLQLQKKSAALINLIKSVSCCNKCDICKNYFISDNKFYCKVTGRVYSVIVACLVTALMLFTLFLVEIVETNMCVQLLISKLDLQSTKATSRLQKTDVVLPDILITNVVIVTILIYFSNYS